MGQPCVLKVTAIAIFSSLQCMALHTCSCLKRVGGQAALQSTLQMARSSLFGLLTTCWVAMARGPSWLYLHMMNAILHLPVPMAYEFSKLWPPRRAWPLQTVGYLQVCYRRFKQANIACGIWINTGPCLGGASSGLHLNLPGLSESCTSFVASFTGYGCLKSSGRLV